MSNHSLGVIFYSALGLWLPITTVGPAMNWCHVQLLGCCLLLGRGLMSKRGAPPFGTLTYKILPNLILTYITVCIICRARGPIYLGRVNIASTAHSKATNRNLTTWKVSKLKKKLTRSDGWNAAMRLTSYCQLMVKKTVQSISSQLWYKKQSSQSTDSPSANTQLVDRWLQ